jgi:outer membrane protein OmpA-like peptidoglycan-associated protein
MSVTATDGFSGKTSVQVTVSDNGASRLVRVPVVVMPEPAKDPVVVPKTLESSIINWKESPNAIGYIVKLDGSAVCWTASRSCAVTTLVGPKTGVEVVSRGNDGLQTSISAEFKAPTNPIPALTVNFRTASSALSSAAKSELREVATVIANAGYEKLQVFGHTDIRGGIDNNKLSLDRAEAVIAYLKTVLPNVQFRVAAYASTVPLGDNKTPEGLALNRRAEISIWP